MSNCQQNLFDLGLKFTGEAGTEDFVDSAAERLKKLVWSSMPRQAFCYDEDDNRKLTLLSVELKGVRRLKKNGKFEFALQRNWGYSGLEECIEDEVVCKDIEGLECMFENEKWDFEQQALLPEDVLFDGRRYFWKFRKNDDNTIEFVEKWLPETVEEEEEGKNAELT